MVEGGTVNGDSRRSSGLAGQWRAQKIEGKIEESLEMVMEERKQRTGAR